MIYDHFGELWQQKCIQTIWIARHTTNRSNHNATINNQIYQCHTQQKTIRRKKKNKKCYYWKKQRELRESETWNYDWFWSIKNGIRCLNRACDALPCYNVWIHLTSFVGFCGFFFLLYSIWLECVLSQKPPHQRLLPNQKSYNQILD